MFEPDSSHPPSLLRDGVLPACAAAKAWASLWARTLAPGLTIPGPLLLLWIEPPVLKPAGISRRGYSQFFYALGIFLLCPLWLRLPGTQPPTHLPTHPPRESSSGMTFGQE